LAKQHEAELTRVTVLDARFDLGSQPPKEIAVFRKELQEHSPEHLAQAVTSGTDSQCVSDALTRSHAEQNITGKVRCNDSKTS